MSKYLLTYHGGSQPESEAARKEVMAQWTQWFEHIDPAVVDAGNPVAQSKTIVANGSVSDGGGANEATGYSLVDAGSLDAAVALAKGCPHLKAGGSVEVSELMAVM
jgi:hypothetical protein